LMANMTTDASSLANQRRIPKIICSKTKLSALKWAINLS
jgi:hypothetical protein